MDLLLQYVVLEYYMIVKVGLCSVFCLTIGCRSARIVVEGGVGSTEV